MPVNPGTKKEGKTIAKIIMAIHFSLQQMVEHLSYEGKKEFKHLERLEVTPHSADNTSNDRRKLHDVVEGCFLSIEYPAN